jgi:hypothetical protein
MYPESIPDYTFWFPFFIIIAPPIPPRLHLRPTLMYHYVPRAPSNHGYLIAMRCCFSKHIQKLHARIENVQNATPRDARHLSPYPAHQSRITSCVCCLSQLLHHHL